MMKLPYLQAYRDRHGTQRFYVRDPAAAQRLPIKADPGDADTFMAAYRDALAALGLPYLPNERRERRRTAHLAASKNWQHWLIARHSPGSRWHRIMRTKCVDDRDTTVYPVEKVDKRRRK
jgi:hypothetical protein